MAATPLMDAAAAAKKALARVDAAGGLAALAGDEDEYKQAMFMATSMRRVISLKDIADDDDEGSDKHPDEEMMDAVSPLMSADTAAYFALQYAEYLASLAAPIKWKEIEPLDKTLLCKHETLPPVPDVMTLTHELLRKLVVVKLNGGLGSRMGLSGPKSALEVRTGQSFLDLTVRQIEFLNTKYGCDVPLILMNSFQTHDETVELIKKYKDHNLQIRCFEQSTFPRLNRNTHAPIPTKSFSMDAKAQWYPPGHGDVYYSLQACGLLDELTSTEEPKEFMFLSNIDNLGATVDLKILYHMMNLDLEFAMEVTEKTRADVQGGAPITYEGQTRLIEVSQVPKEHLVEFHKESRRHRFALFNTNNLWVSLQSVKNLLERDELLLDPFDCSTSSSTIQLETACGSAIRSFDRSTCILVPRDRFLPVKNTSDLLSVQSNLFTANDDRVYGRSFIPVVKLGPEFKRVSDFRRRIPQLPDMRDLDHLTVAGDVRFGSGVVLKGTVIIVANEGCRIDLPDGSVLEDKVVSGNLRILEH